MFDKLSGTVIIRDVAKMSGDELYLRIYGEKENLLYSLDLKSGETPVNFIIDISKEDEIEIELIGYNGYRETREEKYYGGIAELVFYNIPE